MAGHSKWANIKHRKARQDNKKGKIFTKWINELTVASRHGGGDPAANPRLRLAIEKALSANMSRNIIDRAIARGNGRSNEDHIEELTYEGYGPYGVAMIVECVSDNRNRTASLIRHVFSKYGGNLGAAGSVGYLFERRGRITYSKTVDEDVLIEAAIQANADDITVNSSDVDVLTSFHNFYTVRNKLEHLGFTPLDAEILMVPFVTINLDAGSLEEISKIIDVLEEIDDVSNVYSNAN